MKACQATILITFIFIFSEECIIDGHVYLKEPDKPIDNIKALEYMVNVDPSSTLKEMPTSILSNCCFLLDISQSIDLSDFYDGKSWTMTKGAVHKYYKLTIGNGKTCVKAAKQSDEDTIKVTRLRFKNTHSPDVSRLVIVTESSQKVRGDFAIVQYRFQGDPHNIVNKPHGNCRTNTITYPTKRTVLKRIADEVKTQRSNLRVLHTLEEEQGGMLADHPGNLPKNERQVRYVRSKVANVSKDPMMEVLGLESNEDASEKFIQKVS